MYKHVIYFDKHAFFLLLNPKSPAVLSLMNFRTLFISLWCYCLLRFPFEMFYRSYILSYHSFKKQK